MLWGYHFARTEENLLAAVVQISESNRGNQALLELQLCKILRYQLGSNNGSKYLHLDMNQSINTFIYYHSSFYFFKRTVPLQTLVKSITRSCGWCGSVGGGGVLPVAVGDLCTKAAAWWPWSRGENTAWHTAGRTERKNDAWETNGHALGRLLVSQQPPENHTSHTG